MSQPQVLIFGSKDDVDAGWARAQMLAAELFQRRVSVQLVNKLGFILDELHLVARHRVVSTPTVLILKDDKVVYRKLGLPPALVLVETMDEQAARARAKLAPVVS